MSGRKRHASSSESGSGSSSSSSDSESSEDEVGPQIPESVEKDSDKQDSENNEKPSRKVKKRKKLEFEKVYLEDLPNSDSLESKSLLNYQKSFRNCHMDVKSIEFYLLYYEISGLPSYYPISLPLYT